MRPAALALLGAPITVAAVQAAPALSGTGAGRLLFPVVTRVEGARSVGLTFDDGPDKPLEQFLDALDRAGARATFFLLGEQVARWRKAPGQIASAGHEVAVHGYTHRGHLRRTPWDLRDDLRRARDLIEDTAGQKTTLFRPPYGVFSLGSWRESARQGWQRVLWSRWGKDWEETATPQRIADRIGQPRAGDILLLHDSDSSSAPGSWRNTLGALPIILDRIAAAGLIARSVSDLLAEAAASSPCGVAAAV
jgi:peptidoglycan/xylan/chitin deacetylase (PgdA/CDA1 family)